MDSKLEGFWRQKAGKNFVWHAKNLSVMTNSLFPAGHCVFYGAEFWSGILEWSGVKFWSGMFSLLSSLNITGQMTNSKETEWLVEAKMVINNQSCQTDLEWSGVKIFEWQMYVESYCFHHKI